MSIHVCKCTHNGREEYHLRYPGMTEAEARELADRINGGWLRPPEKPKGGPSAPEGYASSENWRVPLLRSAEQAQMFL